MTATVAAMSYDVVDPARPRNVVDALARVVAELPGIGKDLQASQAQGGYAYRGIEAITKSAAPLFAKYGIVFVPQVQSCEIREITVNNKPWTDTILTVRYLICGPGGKNDSIEATVVGIGRDNADKGANKALTQAFKYALIQVLCIADSRDDNDGTHDERDAPPEMATVTQREEIDDRLKVLGYYPDAWKAENLPSRANLPNLTAADYVRAVEILEAEIVGADVPTSEARPGTAAASAPTVPAGDPSEPAEAGTDALHRPPSATSPAPAASEDDDLGRPFD